MTEEPEPADYPLLIPSVRFVDAFGLTRAMLISHALGLMDAKSKTLWRTDLLLAVLRFAPEPKFDDMLAICTQEGVFSCVPKPDDIEIRVNEAELQTRLATLTQYAEKRQKHENAKKLADGMTAPARPRTYINARKRAVLVSNRLAEYLTREREREYIYINNSLSPSTSSLAQVPVNQAIRPNPARADGQAPTREATAQANTASVTGPLTPAEADTFAAAYGINEVEAACLKAASKFQSDQNDAKYPARFRGYVETVLRTAWPKGNPNAHAQNQARRKQAPPAASAAPTPAAPVPAAPPPPAAVLETVQAIRARTGLTTKFGSDPAPKAKRPQTEKSGLSRSGLSRLERDALTKELDAHSKARVEAFMNSPDSREKETEQP